MKNRYNKFNISQLLNKFLCCYPRRFPINNSHYITGKNMLFFSKLICIENELTNLTYSCNNLCNNIKYKFKR